MHPRHGTRERNPRDKRLPPRVRPRSPKHKKDRERDDARHDGDDARARDVAGEVDAGVVRDGGVPEVVHPADGGAGEGAAAHDAGPGVWSRALAGADEEEGEEEDDYRDEEGEGGEAGGVGYLEGLLAVGYDYGSAGDEVLVRVCGD